VAGLGELTGHLSQRLADSGGADPNRVTCQQMTVVLVAEDADGTLLGMITLFLLEAFSGRHGWLEDLVVAPAARGRGAGSALMEAAVRAARERGVEKLLSCSHPRRVAANRTHVAAGFTLSESNLYRTRFDS
jgi:GNAT superfamily N-acetyltransferase